MKESFKADNIIDWPMVALQKVGGSIHILDKGSKVFIVEGGGWGLPKSGSAHQSKDNCEHVRQRNKVWSVWAMLVVCVWPPS
jgi:hypothetical protein